MGGHIQSTEGPNRTNRQRKDEFALSLELGHQPSPALIRGNSWLSGFQAQLRTYTTVSPHPPFSRPTTQTEFHY